MLYIFRKKSENSAVPQSPHHHAYILPCLLLFVKHLQSSNLLFVRPLGSKAFPALLCKNSANTPFKKPFARILSFFVEFETRFGKNKRFFIFNQPMIFLLKSRKSSVFSLSKTRKGFAENAEKIPQISDFSSFFPLPERRLDLRSSNVFNAMKK